MWVRSLLFVNIFLCSLADQEEVSDSSESESDLDDFLYSANAETIAEILTVIPDETEPEADVLPPLHQAAKDGNLTLVTNLLISGHSVNLKTANGETALHYATQGNLIQVARLLINNNISLDATERSSKCTALHFAAIGGHLEMVEILVEAGADVTTVDIYNKTVLHQAVLLGHLSIVKFLVEKSQSNINQQSSDGKTALMFAIGKSREEIAEYLLQYSARCPEKDEFGQTCLHLASLEGMVNLMDHFISIYFIDIADNLGFTPLHFCAMGGKTAACRLLLERGADVNAKNSLNQTAEELAQSLDFPATEILLSNHAKGNYQPLSDALEDALTKSNIVAEKIEQYVNFVTAQSPIKEASSKDLSSIASLNVTNENKLVEQIDRHLAGAQLNAKLWSGISSQLQTSFINIDVFARIFVHKMDQLDNKHPGTLKNISEEMILGELQRKKTELQQRGVSPYRSSVILQHWESDLRQMSLKQKQNVFTNFTSYLIIHASKYQQEAKSLAEKLTNFKHKISEDKENFVNDRTQLKAVTTQTLSEVLTLGGSLKSTRNDLGIENKYLDSIISKIDDVQMAQRRKTIVFASLSLYRSVIAVPELAVKLKNTLRWAYKSKIKTMKLKQGYSNKMAKELANKSWTEWAGSTKKSWKSLKGLIETKMMATKFGSRVLKGSKAVLKVAGKVLPFVTLGVDITMLGLSIKELVTHKKATKEWNELKDKQIKSTEKVRKLMTEYAVLQDRVKMVTFTTEMKVRALDMLEKLEKFVEVAILEADTLAQHWGQIHRNLFQMHVHAKDANENNFQSIRSQLRLMYSSWKPLVSSNAILRNMFVKVKSA